MSSGCCPAAPSTASAMRRWRSTAAATPNRASRAVPRCRWPREIPIEGEPPDVVALVSEYAEWLSQTPTPKLFVNAEPGAILTGPQREFCRTFANQREVALCREYTSSRKTPLTKSAPPSRSGTRGCDLLTVRRLHNSKVFHVILRRNRILREFYSRILWFCHRQRLCANLELATPWVPHSRFPQALETYDAWLPIMTSSGMVGCCLLGMPLRAPAEYIGGRSMVLP